MWPDCAGVVTVPGDLPKVIVASSCSLADQRLQFLEGHFDAVEVGTAESLKNLTSADVALNSDDFGALVIGQVLALPPKAIAGTLACNEVKKCHQLLCPCKATDVAHVPQ